MTINLFFSNVERTVANLVSRDPSANCQSVDSNADEADRLLNQIILNWWSDTEQLPLLASSCRMAEIYGSTIEKYTAKFVNSDNMLQLPVLKGPHVNIRDPFGVAFTPGIWQDISVDCPYVFDFYAMKIHEIKRLFPRAGEIKPEDPYTVLGEDRENLKPAPLGTSWTGTPQYEGGGIATGSYPASESGRRQDRAMVIECWIRDWRKKDGKHVYPGGIRKITITNHGEVVLDDRANPSVNAFLPAEVARNTYGWDHLPLYLERSYQDDASTWGFSSAEQVGDINLKFDQLFTRLSHYISLKLMPPLILPLDSGISKDQIDNRAGLLLQPPTAIQGQGIRFLEVPNISADFFRMLEYYASFFDRISAIQDVDRGEAPGRVEAAAAIMALQERNAVLMRHKIRATDRLVRERGRWAISMYQNFGWTKEQIQVGDEQRTFLGVDLAARKFVYVVDAASTVAKTDLQVQADAKELYGMGAIDRLTLLKRIHFPDAEQIAERMAEGELNIAKKILIESGYPEDPEMAAQMGLKPIDEIMAILSQTQGAPGYSKKAKGMAPSMGVPPAEQGAVPGEEEIMGAG